MSLFQVSIPIAGDQVDPLEGLLFEVDDGHWNIFLDQDTQVGTAAGVYEDEAEARETWRKIGPFFEELLGELDPSFEELPDTDWKDSYKEHFQPWNFGGLHWVPVWKRDDYPAPDGEAVVWLDPGMAFGTGNHETTRLCIEAMIEYLDRQQRAGRFPGELSCCDAGCGSGILAISAKKLGIGSVVGFDTDPDSVRISYENTELNQLDGEVEYFEGNLMTGFRSQSFDLVFANILAVVLIEFAEELLTVVNPGGRLILSGILTIEARNVEHTFRERLHNCGRAGRFSRHELGEWSDVVIDLEE